MKEAAQFVLDFLVEAPPGTLCPGAFVTNPSFSPENWFRTTNGAQGHLTYAATMDLELIGDLFDRCISASEILKVDDDFRRDLETARRRLPPLQLSQEGSFKGRLQEWIGDWDDSVDREHRHVSHLYALMPSQRITRRETPAFAAAARRVLEVRGDGGTGWSKAWKVGLWARLGEGDHALKLLEGLIKESTLPNLFDTCPPFQIDGNFGGSAGVAEMLLQSRDKGYTMRELDGKLAAERAEDCVLDLLPALPGNWKSGRVTGLCARGGFQVNLAWKEGKLAEATIQSKCGGPCLIWWGDKHVTLDTKPGRSYRLNKDFSFQEGQRQL